MTKNSSPTGGGRGTTRVNGRLYLNGESVVDPQESVRSAAAGKGAAVGVSALAVDEPERRTVRKGVLGRFSEHFSSEKLAGMATLLVMGPTIPTKGVAGAVFAGLRKKRKKQVGDSICSKNPVTFYPPLTSKQFTPGMAAGGGETSGTAQQLQLAQNTAEFAFSSDLSSVGPVIDSAVAMLSQGRVLAALGGGAAVLALSSSPAQRLYAHAGKLKEKLFDGDGKPGRHFAPTSPS